MYQRLLFPDFVHRSGGTAFVCVATAQRAALPSRTTRHTTSATFSLRVYEVLQHGQQREWGSCVSPSVALACRGHTSVAFPSRHPSKSLFIRTGFAGANRRRPECFFLSHCPSVDGLRNCLFGMPSVRGLPPSRRIRRPSVVTGDPGRRQRRCAPPELKVGTRWDGGGSHRQAGPCREQLSSRNRSVALKVPPNTSQLSTQGSRLDAGPSTYWCHHEMTHGVVLAGRAGKTYSATVRVPSKNLFSGAVRPCHGGSLLVTP